MEKIKKEAMVPVPAATVILIRQHKEELQVYLLKRHPRSVFMAGHYVFPGGKVETADKRGAEWHEYADLDLAEVVFRLGGELTGAEALSYAVAAIRETFEEAGVLLADTAGSSSETLDGLGEQRLTSGMPKGWFFKQARAEGWTLTLSALSRWSHWITPKRMHRRYDTRFFLAAMPRRQTCRPDTRETTNGLWISPAKGLASNLAGDVPLSPPTLIVLDELLAFTSIDDLLVSARDRAWGTALLPRLIPWGKEAVIIEPWDVHYDKEEVRIDTNGLEKALLPVGAPFSRLWYHAGRWRPIRS